MSRFLQYSTEQANLLPPNLRDELGGDYLCFFVHEVVERLDHDAPRPAVLTHTLSAAT